MWHVCHVWHVYVCSPSFFRAQEDDDTTNKLALVIGAGEQTLDATESAFIESVESKFDIEHSKDYIREPLSTYTRASTAIYRDKRTGLAVGGELSVVVDDTIAKAAAWQMSRNSRRYQKSHYETNHEHPRVMVDVNDHHAIQYSCRVIKVPLFMTRDYCTRRIWKWSEDMSTLTYVRESIEHPDFPRVKHYNRGWTSITCVYEKMPPIGTIPQTRVHWKQFVEDPLRENPFTRFLFRKMLMKSMHFVKHMRDVFDKSVALDEYHRGTHLENINKETKLGGSRYSEEVSAVVARLLRIESNCFALSAIASH